MITRNFIIETISGLFILLFVYTGISKLYDIPRFQNAISQSPLIGSYAFIIAWAIPILELIIALLLFIPKLRMIGLILSTTLMILFTSYVGYMILFTPKLPCTCGGVINNFTWRDHLAFNIGYTLLGLWGIWLNRRKSSGNLGNKNSGSPTVTYA